MPKAASTDREPTPAEVRETENRFIEVWGDISSLWGVSRSLGQIQALLYLSPKPLSLEGVSKRLSLSHGATSMGLRDLLAWGVIRRVHLPAERKVHFEAEQDPWTWFHRCIAERRRREVIPVMESLHAVARAAKEAEKTAKSGDRERAKLTADRIERFTKFNEEFIDLMDVFLAVGAGTMGKTLRVLAKVVPKRDRGL